MSDSERSWNLGLEYLKGSLSQNPSNSTAWMKLAAHFDEKDAQHFFFNMLSSPLNSVPDDAVLHLAKIKRSHLPLFWQASRNRPALLKKIIELADVDSRPWTLVERVTGISLAHWWGDVPDSQSPVGRAARAWIENAVELGMVLHSKGNGWIHLMPPDRYFDLMRGRLEKLDASELFQHPLFVNQLSED
ncbi:MAG: hypothetical protein AAB425_02170, partial [Bdellovibrionota bacterium]